MFVPYYCTKIFNMKKFEQVWLGQIDVVIANNIANVDFRITDVAKELDVSRTKLYRDVLKLTGVTPSRYIQQTRLKKAKQILEDGVCPTVKETAMIVGFKRSGYFTKLFFREYAILPSKLLKG